MCSSCFALVRSCARATPQKRTMVRNNATGVCVMTACSTTLRLPFDKLLCGCQVANAQMLLCFFFLLNHPRPKRDLLLCVARRTAHSGFAPAPQGPPWVLHGADVCGKSSGKTL